MTPRGLRVSVVVPVFDRAAMLGELLRSLAAQTWRDLEVVIVDDGSRDLDGEKFALLAAAAAGTVATRYIRTARRGPAAARNTGIAAASGTFLHFLDSDDLLFPEAIATLVEALGDEAYVIGRIVDIDVSLSGPFFETHRSDPGNLLRDVEWCTHAALYRREVITALGGYDEALRVGEDTLLQLRVRLAHGAGARSNTFLGVRRHHRRGHLSLGTIVAADRHQFLLAVAPVVGGDPVFRTEAASVRLTSLAVFLLILAGGGGHRSPELPKAFATVTEALLHDRPVLRRGVSRIAQPDARGWLAVAGAAIRAGRALRALRLVWRRRLATPRTDTLVEQLAVLRRTVAEPVAPLSTRCLHRQE